MQDPNEDTEWNDLLRKKGILPPKPKEVSEDEVVQLLEETVKERTKEGKQLDEMDLDELDELEDDEEERVLQQYRCVSVYCRSGRQTERLVELCV